MDNRKIQNSGIGLSKKLARGDLSQTDYAELLKAWTKAEDELGVSLSCGFSEKSFFLDASEEFVRERIFPFLDKTGLILSGGDLQTMFEISVEGRDYLFSYREWGAYMAEWMTERNYPGGPWDYLNFYMSCYVTAKIPDYDQYLSNLHELLEKKKKLQQSGPQDPAR